MAENAEVGGGWRSQLEALRDEILEAGAGDLRIASVTALWWSKRLTDLLAAWPAAPPEEVSSDCLNCCTTKSACDDQIPRRCRLDLNTPAELAIRAAMDAVEALPADVRLTDAVVLLGRAKDRVADFVDGIESALPAAPEGRTLREQQEQEQKDDLSRVGGDASSRSTGSTAERQRR